MTSRPVPCASGLWESVDAGAVASKSCVLGPPVGQRRGGGRGGCGWGGEGGIPLFLHLRWLHEVARKGGACLHRVGAASCFVNTVSTHS